MGMGNQRRMGAPFQMGSGRPGIVPRGGSRNPFMGQPVSAMAGGGQMLTPSGRPPSAPQGGFSSIGNSWMPQNPGGVQAAPAEGARPNAPWGGNDVNSYFLGGRPVNTPTEYTPPAGLLPGSPNLGGIGQPNSGPDQWAGMSGSEIFARLFNPQQGANEQLARAMGGRP